MTKIASTFPDFKLGILKATCVQIPRVSLDQRKNGEQVPYRIQQYYGTKTPIGPGHD